MTQPQPEQRQEAQDWARQNLSPNMGPMRQVLVQALADGYVSAALATGEAIPGAHLVAGAEAVYGPDWKKSWDAWEPGSVEAALLLDEGGWADLLDSADIVIRGIEDTILDRIGSVLAQGALDGASVDAIASDIADLISDPERAYTIADTELARAMGLASMDMYNANGIKTWDWLLSPGACDVCQERQANNPQSMDAPPPPAHPHCRCSPAPNDPGA